MSLIGSVVLEGLQEEGGALLDLVELQKDGDNLIDLSLWWALVSVCHHSGEADSRLRVDRHDLPQNLDKIRGVAGLLAVWHDLVQLVGLDKPLDDLVGRAGLLIDAEGHLWVGRSNEVSELVGHGELLLLDPVLYQIELVLLNDRSGELDGLDGVQLGGLQEGVEIDEDRGWSSGRRQVLELVNGFLVSQKGSWGVSGDRSCTSVVTGGKLLVEHKDEEIVGSGEVEPLGQLERELLVARNVTGRVDVRDKIVLFDVDRVDLSSAVDHDHAVSLFVSSGDEAELVCYLLSVEERGGGDLVHVKEAHLCDNEDDTVLWAVLHQHREVSCLLHLEIS